jgi:hypothetical protein
MIIFVKPKDGVTIRRPDTGRMLAAEGEKVVRDTFWRRRIAEGDVEEIGGEEETSEPTGGETEPPKKESGLEKDAEAYDAEDERGEK